MKTKVMLATLIFALLWVMTPIQADADLATGGPGPRPIEFFTNNYVDWSSLGLAGTELGSGISVTATNYGTTVTVSTSTETNLRRVDQTPPFTIGIPNWNGNFAPEDALLWTYNVDEAKIIFDFSTEIFGGIAQVQSEELGEFTGSLLAFDEFGNQVGSTVFEIAGESTDLANNSAIFLGQLVNSGNVRRLVFSAYLGHDPDSFIPTDFAINRLDFLQCPLPPEPPSMIPLPASIYLLGSGLLGLGLLGRRSRKRG